MHSKSLHFNQSFWYIEKVFNIFKYLNIEVYIYIYIILLNISEQAINKINSHMCCLFIYFRFPLLLFAVWFWFSIILYSVRTDGLKGAFSWDLFYTTLNKIERTIYYDVSYNTTEDYKSSAVIISMQMRWSNQNKILINHENINIDIRCT